MKVTISLDFDAIKEDVCNEFINRLDSLGYSEEQISNLEKSFMENIDAGYMDVTFEVETNKNETDVTSCFIIGG